MPGHTARTSLFLICSGLFLSFCNRSTEVVLNVESTDNQKNPVPHASITINHKLVGKTDEEGKFEGAIVAGHENLLRLEVNRKSGSHYYAPYFETFEINTEQPKQEFKVKAVLYQVPKPGYLDPPLTETMISAESSDEKSPVSTEEKPEQKSALSEPAVKDPAVTLTQTTEETVPTQDNHEASHPGGSDALSKLLKVINPDFPERRNSVPESKEGALTRLINFRVTSGQKPVARAEIYYGIPREGRLIFLCHTDVKGRCSRQIMIPSGPPLAFKVKKTGFSTKTLRRKLASRNIIRVNLQARKSLDLFLLSQDYSGIKGAPRTDLYLNNRRIGKTDTFGHLSWDFSSLSEDLQKFSFRNKDLLPEYFSHEFVFDQHLTIAKMVSNKNFLLPRVTVLPPAVRKGNGPAYRDYSQVLEKMIRSGKLLKISPSEIFAADLNLWNSSFLTAQEKGWDGLLLRSPPDLLLSTEINNQPEWTDLLVTLSDNKGRIIHASRKKFKGRQNTVQNLAQKSAQTLEQSLRYFSFLGPVEDAGEDTVSFSPSEILKPFLKPGGHIQVMGMYMDKSGRNRKSGLTGRGYITAGKPGSSVWKARLTWTRPRSVIARGDLIKTNIPVPVEVSTMRIKGPENPVQGAMIFEGETLLAVSDTAGYMNFRKAPKVNSKQTLIHPRFRAVNRDTGRDGPWPSVVSLEPAAQRIRIETQPPGSIITLNGKQLGQSPLYTTLPPDKGSHEVFELKTSGPPGYLSHTAEFKGSDLEGLTGGKALVLWPDLLTPVAALANLGQIKKSLEMLRKIPSLHPSWLQARHMEARILLEQAHDPVASADVFRKLLSALSEITPKSTEVQNSLSATRLNLALAILASSESQQPDMNEIADLLNHASVNKNQPFHQRASIQKSYLSLFSGYLRKDPEASLSAEEMRKKWLNFLILTKTDPKTEDEYRDLVRHAMGIIPKEFQR